jgi:hypothetical protein
LNDGGGEKVIMELREYDANHVVLKVSLHDLGIMGNALNEVCHGINVQDFEEKMGAEKEAVEQTLDSIIPVYRRKRKLGKSSVVARFTRSDLRAIIGALEEVDLELDDDDDFAARMGAERWEAQAILDTIVPIYHQMGLEG